MDRTLHKSKIKQKNIFIKVFNEKQFQCFRYETICIFWLQEKVKIAFVFCKILYTI